MLSMCSFHLRLAEISTPRYLAWSTTSSTWPWRWYTDGIGLRARETLTTWHLLGLNSRGGNFHYKGIYRCAAGMGYTFQASQYMNGYHFYIKSISMGYLFHPKSIWMGKIWKIVYEWGQFSKIVYEWGQFSIWEVYEWVMFFTWPGIWMGWGSGTPAAHPYPKSWQVTPPWLNSISHSLSQTCRWSKSCCSEVLCVCLLSDRYRSCVVGK